MSRMSTEIDQLENRKLFASAHPIAMSIGDEALWNSNFPTVVAELKRAGVTSVRIWLGFTQYSDRPTAWDPDPFPNQITTEVASTSTGVTAPTKEQTNPPGRVLKRIFELKQAGFDVTATIQPRDGNAAANTQEVRDLVGYLLNSPSTPGGTYKLKDAVDRWEIGNEPDLGHYWTDSATNIQSGLVTFVDKLLIPAAETLKAAGETVISGGPVTSGDYVYTILNTLKTRGKLNFVDYAGFHPYSTYFPDDPTGTNAQKDKVNKAIGFAGKFGKKLIATEWNVRGYSLQGTQDATWARAADLNYRNVIRDNFEIAYYFSSINNWAARGGSASARPAGLMKHVSTLGVKPTSDITLKSQFYSQPLVPNEPFYSVINTWQIGTVSGTLFNDTNSNGTLDASESPVSARKVYIDANNNGSLDSTEPSATSDSTGKYTLTYRTGQTPAGTYTLRQVLPSDWTQTTSARSITIASLKNESGVNLGSKQVVVSTIGSLSGTIWSDTNANGLIDPTETRLSGCLIYLDNNNNNTFDAGEPSATSGTDGKYVISIDTLGAAQESKPLRAVLPTYFEPTAPSTLSYNSAVLPGVVQDTFHFGMRPLTGSVSGTITSDANNNGIVDVGETVLSGVTVYIDTNNNAVLDAGEITAVSNASGAYTLTYSLDKIAPGNYSLREVLPAGAIQTIPVDTFRTMTVAAYAFDTGFDFALYQTAILPGGFSGVLWSDTNANSIIDNTEPTLDGRVVYIDTNTNNSLDIGELSTTTAANGSYSFTGLLPGTYRVTRVLPTGYRITTTNDGYQLVTLTSGQTLTNINIGATARTLLRGNVSTTVNPSGVTSWQVYIDKNSNGIFDSGDASQMTDAQGNYAFIDQLTATYKIRINAPAGWKTNTPSTGLYTIYLAAGKTANNLNFTMAPLAVASRA